MTQCERMHGTADQGARVPMGSYPVGDNPGEQRCCILMSP